MTLTGSSGGKTLTLILFFLTAALLLSAQDLLKEGETAFLNNEPEKAVTLLSPVVDSGPTAKEPYLYMGISLQQLGRYSDAVAVFTKAVEKTLPPYDKLYFNMGNNYFLMEKDTDAERAYGRAIQENNRLSSAYLNRANTRMRLTRYRDAVADYRMYLIQKPDSPQKPVIEELINRVESFMMSEEERKQQEEAARLAEEERQKALLQSVLSSLQNADEATVNMRAESESIQSSEIELDIAD